MLITCSIVSCLASTCSTHYVQFFGGGRRWADIRIPFDAKLDSSNFYELPQRCIVISYPVLFQRWCSALLASWWRPPWPLACSSFATKETLHASEDTTTSESAVESQSSDTAIFKPSAFYSSFYIYRIYQLYSTLVPK